MRENIKWLVVLGVCVLVLIIAFIGAVTGKDADSETESRTPQKLKSVAPTLAREEITRRLEAAEQYVPPDPLEGVYEIIDGHRARIEEEPDSPEAPALLEAMGNLYTLRIEDHGMAAYCYQQILDRYPDYAGKANVYPLLATAYEKAGDDDNTTRVYMEMLRLFPEDSVEYLWASDKLGIQRWEGPDVVHPGSPEEAEMLRQRAALAAELEASEIDAPPEEDAEDALPESTPDTAEDQSVM